MSESRGAAIDIGSNSCRFLVAATKEGGIVPLRGDLEITRLAAGVDNCGNLSDSAIERTFAVLSEFREIIEAEGVDRTAAVGTSALREVNNSSHLLARVEDELGISVDVISGEREAELILAGVESKEDRRADLVIDIGGGSTEIIYESNAENVIALSRKVGAVRFTERFVDDPSLEFSDTTCASIKDAAAENFWELDLPPVQAGDAGGVFGVGGTITTLAAIELEMEEYRPEEIEDFNLGYEQIENIVAELAEMPLSLRREVTGLEPGRADVILAGALILLALMDEAGFDSLKVSDRGVLYGLLTELLPA